MNALTTASNSLVNNRDLQADFQEIGIAHADWVQSRLLSNPSLDFLLRFPTDGGLGMLEAIASMELLELWRIPVRSEAARKRLEATVLRMRFGLDDEEPKTLKEIGECLGLTRERVRQIESEALSKLSESLAVD